MLDAELLLAHCLGTSRSGLYARPRGALEPSVLVRWHRCVEERANGRPLAYITGTREFMGLEFQVDERVLIPRPETELLVELAGGWLDHCRKAAPMVADIGTGCGCIAVALARAHARASVYAVDLSPEALLVAEANRAQLRPAGRTVFLAGNLLKPLPQPVNLVVANLPYVTDAEWAALPEGIRLHEPEPALRAGPDGLDAIRDLLEDLPDRLLPGGAVMLEHGLDQGAEIRRLLGRMGCFAAVSTHTDLAGLERCTVGLGRHAGQAASNSPCPTVGTGSPTRSRCRPLPFPEVPCGNSGRCQSRFGGR